MRVVSMRSVAGEDPVVIAAIDPGETVTEGDTVQSGAGVVTLVAGAQCSIRCAIVGEGRPLQRAIRDGLTTLTLDGGA